MRLAASRLSVVRFYASASLAVLTVLAAAFSANAVVLTANTGPGGFTALGPGSDLTLWLRGDAGITKDASDYVSAWADQSGRGNDVSQANALQQPVSSTTRNGVPLVTFSGAAEPSGERDEMLSASSVNAQTFFIANITHDQFASANPIIGNSTNYISIRRLSGEGWRHPGDVNDFANPAGSTFRVDGAPGSDSVLDVPQVLNAVRHPDPYNFAQLKLAQHKDFSERAWNGSMGELVAFNRKLNQAETIVVDNYLSAKFGVALNTGAGANDIYAGDATAQGDYDRDVIGVGRVDPSNEVTAAGAAGLGLEASGTVANGAFVAAGHKTPSNSLTVADVPASVQRWDRVWYVDKTSKTDASLTFDHGDAGVTAPGGSTQYALLLSDTNAFSFSQVEATPTIDGDRVSFDVPNAELQDGYYTLAQIAPTTGPGGFTALGPGSDLTLWLRGDAGITKDASDHVSAWADQSGRGNDVSQANALQQPVSSTTRNGVPLVAFAGGSEPAGERDEMLSASAVDAQTIFIANITQGHYSSANPIIGNSTSWISIRWDSGIGWRYPGDQFDFANPAGSTFRVDGAPGSDSVLDVPQVLNAVRHPDPYNFTQLKLAQHRDFSERAWNGSMGEVLVFNRKLNQAETIVIDNYLSAKFDIDLNTGAGASDLYAGDESANGDYDFDLIGAGRVDASNLLTVAHAMGLGIELTGGLDDGEFVMAAHKSPVNGWTTDDSNGRFNSRWERVWYIDEPASGDVDTLLTFDFSEGGLLNGPDASRPYGLLYSPTNAFDFSPLALPPVISGDQVTFALSEGWLADGYYTLGVVPEPSSLALLGVGMLGLLGFSGRRRTRRG